MKFLVVLSTLLTTALASTAGTAAYDTVYDAPALSTLSTSCSDGANGLFTKGYSTLGSIPRFPFVAAAPTIAGWNSPNCGKCFKVWYKDPALPASAKGVTIYVTGVDSSRGSGFVLSKAAMDALTGGKATQLGRVDVMWDQQIALTNCGR